MNTNTIWMHIILYHVISSWNFDRLVVLCISWFKESKDTSICSFANTTNGFTGTWQLKQTVVATNGFTGTWQLKQTVSLPTLPMAFQEPGSSNRQCRCQHCQWLYRNLAAHRQCLRFIITMGGGGVKDHYLPPTDPPPPTTTTTTTTI